MIDAKNIRKVYPNGTTALDGLSVSVQPGEFVGVLGASGAGKTTFFKLLNGTLLPTGGELNVLGQRLDGGLPPAKLRRLRSRIALISQHHNVVAGLSVLNNVLMGRLGRISTLSALAGFVRPPQPDLQRALEAIALVGLADKAYTRADDLSGGQQQRVAIARALVQNAELILADEPIASVDMLNASLILDLFKRLNTELGCTVLMNLHQLDFAVRYCPRLLVFRQGRLVYDGAPEGVERFEDLYTTTAEAK
jgi:phosphonate transport system ATP-binding protein